ncbi:MAG: hypothetical protein ACLQBX_17340 [Candidatus Limnocylindrales bacterium]|jgi:hypothetical protein
MANMLDCLPLPSLLSQVLTAFMIAQRGWQEVAGLRSTGSARAAAVR